MKKWGKMAYQSLKPLKKLNFCLTLRGISVNFIFNVGKSGEFGIDNYMVISGGKTDNVIV
jgi:hypothetical protein